MASSISIFIRARNEARFIGSCLERIYAQTARGEIEVIVLDSGSTDGTTEICRRFPVRLFERPAAEFNYGRALNFGVRESRGDIFVPLSAHCLPADDGWLRPLIATLANARIAGVYSRQLPFSWAHPVERDFLARTFPAAAHEQHPPQNTDEFIQPAFSNASAALRRALVLETPFAEIPYAEDLVWAGCMLRRGYIIAYAPASQVYHSHRGRYRYAFRVGRTFGAARRIASTDSAMDRRASRTVALPRTCFADFRHWYSQARIAGRGRFSALCTGVDCAMYLLASRLGARAGYEQNRLPRQAPPCPGIRIAPQY